MAPKNVTVNSINTKFLSAFPGEAIMSMLGYEIVTGFLFTGVQSRVRLRFTDVVSANANIGQ